MVSLIKTPASVAAGGEQIDEVLFKQVDLVDLEVNAVAEINNLGRFEEEVTVYLRVTIGIENAKNITPFKEPEEELRLSGETNLLPVIIRNFIQQNEREENVEVDEQLTNSPSSENGKNEAQIICMKVPDFVGEQHDFNVIKTKTLTEDFSSAKQVQMREGVCEQVIKGQVVFVSKVVQTQTVCCRVFLRDFELQRDEH